MHPDNESVIDLSSGKLYIKDPVTGTPLELGKVTSMEITPPEEFDPLGEPLPLRTAQEFEMEIELEPDPEVLRELFDPMRAFARECLGWAILNRPKLLHLAAYAKTARRRRKNSRRIVQEFIRDLNMEGQQ